MLMSLESKIQYSYKPDKDLAITADHDVYRVYCYIRKMQSTRLKGKYHENLQSFQNPKMFDC